MTDFVNHGIRYGQRPTDYVASLFTFITWENRNPSGEWRPYLPIGEKQFGKEDTMGCVSFSALNSIEIQEKFLTGQQPNYSDRWIGKMSGTTIEGNYLYLVGDAIRNLGLVLESDYPAPLNYTFNQYYATIPDPLLAQLKIKGQAWKQKWTVKTEFITPTKAEMLKHIKHAPLQIVIPGHAIIDFLCEQDIVDYFDTYEPFQKQIAYNQITSAYKYILTKNMDKPRYLMVNDGGKIYVVVLQGFCVGGAAAKSMEALGQLKLALEVPTDTLTYILPSLPESPV